MTEILVIPPKCAGVNGTISVVGPFGGAIPYEITYFNQPVVPGEFVNCNGEYVAITLKFKDIPLIETLESPNVVSANGACLFKTVLLPYPCNLSGTFMTGLASAYMPALLVLFSFGLNSYLTLNGFPPCAVNVDYTTNIATFYVPSDYWGGCTMSAVEGSFSSNPFSTYIDVLYGGVVCCPSPISINTVVGTPPAGGWTSTNPPPTYSYVSGGIGFTFISVPPGKYLVQIKDANGVIGFVTVIIPPAIEYPCLDAIVTHETCDGKNDGTISLPSYFNEIDGELVNYEWSSLSGSPGPIVSTPLTSGGVKDITNLSPGLYCVKISSLINPNLCIESCCFQIQPAESIDIVATLEQPTCASCGDTGTLIIRPTGGNCPCDPLVTSPYFYSLDGAPFVRLGFGNTSRITGLTVGTHVIFVKCSDCCYSEYNFSIVDNIISVEV